MNSDYSVFKKFTYDDLKTGLDQYYRNQEANPFKDYMNELADLIAEKRFNKKLDKPSGRDINCVIEAIIYNVNVVFSDAGLIEEKASYEKIADKCHHEQIRRVNNKYIQPLIEEISFQDILERAKEISPHRHREVKRVRVPKESHYGYADIENEIYEFYKKNGHEFGIYAGSMQDATRTIASALFIKKGTKFKAKKECMTAAILSETMNTFSEKYEIKDPDFAEKLNITKYIGPEYCRKDIVEQVRTKYVQPVAEHISFEDIFSNVWKSDVERVLGKDGKGGLFWK